MKNIYLVGMVSALLLVVSATFALAHTDFSDSSLRSTQSEDVGHCGVSFDEMDEMHDEMISSLDDPVLVSEMNEMHEKFMDSYDNHDKYENSHYYGGMMDRGMGMM